MVVKKGMIVREEQMVITTGNGGIVSRWGSPSYQEVRQVRLRRNFRSKSSSRLFDSEGSHTSRLARSNVR